MFFVLDFIVPLLTTCFGPDRWPSSGNMYTNIYIEVTTVYVNRSVESAA
jgi:hypothetical protein